MTIRVNHVENADWPLNDRRLTKALQRLFSTASSASSLFRTMALPQSGNLSKSHELGPDLHGRFIFLQRFVQMMGNYIFSTLVSLTVIYRDVDLYSGFVA